MLPKDRIFFRNEYERNLFECMLKGQISDGMYENSSPDWEYWVTLESSIGDTPGRTESSFLKRCKKDNYSFRGLYDIVGEEIDAIFKLTSLGFDIPAIEKMAWKFSSIPNNIGDYEEDFIEKVATNKKFPNGVWIRNDYSIEALELLRDKFGEERMVSAWNNAVVPPYNVIIKGVRQSMKNVLNSNELNNTTQTIDIDLLRKHVVKTVATSSKIRVIASTKPGQTHYVSFPNSLRTEPGLYYYVGSNSTNNHNYETDPELRFNGKNYIATAKDGISKLTKEELEVAKKIFRL